MSLWNGAYGTSPAENSPVTSGSTKEAPLLLQFISFYLDLASSQEAGLRKQLLWGCLGSRVPSCGCQHVSLACGLCEGGLKSRRISWNSPRQRWAIPAGAEGSSKGRHGLAHRNDLLLELAECGEVFGLRWQPGSPWSPVPYQYTSAAEHLATSQKWYLRLYFPHCQILNNRPVTCNTCCKSVSVRVWTSGVLVLYTTSLIHCSLSGSLHSSCAKWSSVLIGSVKYISPIEREVPPDKYSSH